MADTAYNFNGDTAVQTTTRDVRTVIGYFAAACAVGATVEFDNVEPPGGGTNPGAMAFKAATGRKVVGVKVGSAAVAGSWGEIQVKGPCEGVLATAATTAIVVSDFVNGSAGSATRVEIADAAAVAPRTITPVLGRALSALPSGTGTITVDLFNPANL